MATDPTISLNIHVKDDTTFEAVRVPSSGEDFVALKIGFPANILLFNTTRAKALGAAVAEAFKILSQVDTEKAAAEMISTYENSRIANCTITNPCDDCLELEASQDYSDWDYEDQPF